LFKSFPLGMTDGEIENCLLTSGLFDEYNNNFIPEMLYTSEAYLLSQLILKKKSLVGGDKNFYGYFSNVNSSHTNYGHSSYTVTRRNSFTSGINLSISTQDDNLTNRKLFTYIIDRCFLSRVEVSKSIYLPHLNLLFTLNDGVIDSKIEMF